ncbi:Seg1p ASCRUDRAFT_71236 [Ascoidea rubescens DSM 1968]|uniref:Uncharacterized protein n=1 Tax=Ascoidea rubescens DSM 1968 TaxID=1344418 RepID=A0A1D2VET5_9ASCO|nr:hypothetical protein ASCRUDRAFT_71236 [Ascoidea rubescens DSM 1968]ODV60208.1 hypothetical protein ASCRUDRAFT_71236 [Ascoidea rubescens DSM 1968]
MGVFTFGRRHSTNQQQAYTGVNKNLIDTSLKASSNAVAAANAIGRKFSSTPASNIHNTHNLPPVSHKRYNSLPNSSLSNQIKIQSQINANPNINTAHTSPSSSTSPSTFAHNNNNNNINPQFINHHTKVHKRFSAPSSPRLSSPNDFHISRRLNSLTLSIDSELDNIQEEDLHNTSNVDTLLNANIIQNNTNNNSKIKSALIKEHQLKLPKHKVSFSDTSSELSDKDLSQIQPQYNNNQTNNNNNNNNNNGAFIKPVYKHKRTSSAQIKFNNTQNPTQNQKMIKKYVPTPTGLQLIEIPEAEYKKKIERTYSIINASRINSSNQSSRLNSLSSLSKHKKKLSISQPIINEKEQTTFFSSFSSSKHEIPSKFQNSDSQQPSTFPSHPPQIKIHSTLPSKELPSKDLIHQKVNQKEIEKEDMQKKLEEKEKENQDIHSKDIKQNIKQDIKDDIQQNIQDNIQQNNEHQTVKTKDNIEPLPSINPTSPIDSQNKKVPELAQISENQTENEKNQIENEKNQQFPKEDSQILSLNHSPKPSITLPKKEIPADAFSKTHNKMVSSSEDLSTVSRSSVMFSSSSIEENNQVPSSPIQIHISDIDEQKPQPMAQQIRSSLLNLPINNNNNNNNNNNLSSSTTNDNTSNPIPARRKSALKKSSASITSQQSSIGVLKPALNPVINPAEQAYLSLTTAENTRLNAQLSSSSKTQIKRNTSHSPSFRTTLREETSPNSIITPHNPNIHILTTLRKSEPQSSSSKLVSLRKNSVNKDKPSRIQRNPLSSQKKIALDSSFQTAEQIKPKINFSNFSQPNASTNSNNLINTSNSQKHVQMPQISTKEQEKTKRGTLITSPTAAERMTFIRSSSFEKLRPTEKNIAFKRMSLRDAQPTNQNNEYYDSYNYAGNDNYDNDFNVPNNFRSRFADSDDELDIYSNQPPRISKTPNPNSTSNNNNSSENGYHADSSPKFIKASKIKLTSKSKSRSKSKHHSKGFDKPDKQSKFKKLKKLFGGGKSK